jgi:hypothetical protein
MPERNFTQDSSVPRTADPSGPDDQLGDRPDHDLGKRCRDAEPDRQQTSDQRETQPQCGESPYSSHRRCPFEACDLSSPRMCSWRLLPGPHDVFRDGGEKPDRQHAHDDLLGSVESECKARRDRTARKTEIVKPRFERSPAPGPSSRQTTRPLGPRPDGHEINWMLGNEGGNDLPPTPSVR